MKVEHFIIWLFILSQVSLVIYVVVFGALDMFNDVSLVMDQLPGVF